MSVPTRGTAQTSAPYMDIELCFDADRSQVALARSVAAEVAHREDVEPEYVEKVRHVTGTLISALVVLARPNTQMQCLFRVLDGEIRICVSVPGVPDPSAAAKSEHARMLDHLVVAASTFTTPDGSGGVSVVSDAFVPVGG